MPLNVDLEPIEKLAGGRVHLTVVVPESGPVRTLCGITFGAGRFRRAREAADCRLCLRRREDDSFISGALFQHDMGSKLLEMSLAQAGQAPPRPRLTVLQGSAGVQDSPSPPADEAREVRPAEPPAKPDRASELPARIGEVRTRGFRRLSAEVLVTRGGAVVELSDGGEDAAITRVRADGPLTVTREGGDLLIQAGDVRVRVSGDIALDCSTNEEP